MNLTIMPKGNKSAAHDFKYSKGNIKLKELLHKGEIAHHEQVLFLSQCFQKVVCMLQTRQYASLCGKGLLSNFMFSSLNSYIFTKTNLA